MTNVDQFESIFRSAAKPTLGYERPAVRSILVVTDLDEYGADRFLGSVRTFLRMLGDEVSFHVVTGDQFASVEDLLKLVEQHRPDLVCSYRHLHTEGWRHRLTLGDHTEVLTQATSVPILVLPHPARVETSDDAVQVDLTRGTSAVMAITDHLAADDRLVNWSVLFTEADGTLFLTHIEDETTFERYVATISRIPEIDTDLARESIRARLMKEPRDFIESCHTVLLEHGSRVRLEPIVTIGHHLSEYERLVAEHAVQLLVMNTKDEDQMAMHGLAYPLAVQLVHIPILML